MPGWELRHGIQVGDSRRGAALGRPGAEGRVCRLSGPGCSPWGLLRWWEETACSGFEGEPSYLSQCFVVAQEDLEGVAGSVGIKRSAWERVGDMETSGLGAKY